MCSKRKSSPSPRIWSGYHLIVKGNQRRLETCQSGCLRFSLSGSPAYYVFHFQSVTGHVVIGLWHWQTSLSNRQ
jgi:hypothetical protein